MVNVSIVLYKHSMTAIDEIIKQCNGADEIKTVYLVNNFNNTYDNIATFPKVHYIQNNHNIGYGAGHNIAFKYSIEQRIPYHIVLNPDVSFEPQCIKEMVKHMNYNPEIGLLMPKVYYPNGELQRLCKLLPTPIDLFLRRFAYRQSSSIKHIEHYELKNFNYDRIANIPNLSGCFMFLRTDILSQVGLFDQRYFMYLEDVDLVRRIHKVSKTVFYPNVSITHGYVKGSYTNYKLLSHHIMSAIKYFNKWGWIYDKERQAINNRVLTDLLSNDK